MDLFELKTVHRYMHARSTCTGLFSRGAPHALHVKHKSAAISQRVRVKRSECLGHGPAKLNRPLLCLRQVEVWPVGLIVFVLENCAPPTPHRVCPSACGTFARCRRLDLDVHIISYQMQTNTHTRHTQTQTHAHTPIAHKHACTTHTYTRTHIIQNSYIHSTAYIALHT